MVLFGVYVELYVVIIIAAILALLIFLIILSIIKSDKNVADVDTREDFGDFHGLLTKEDFEVRAEHPMVETYRMQWIKAAPGDMKDNYLLFYLALKQLIKEQDETEDEWTQEQCEARMDEIVKELSEKTGIQITVDELPETEFDTYFDQEDVQEYDDEYIYDENEVEE